MRLEDRFSCPGFRIVEDRKIRCHKIGGHGGETFLQGVMNSCNPVFIDVGQRLGVEKYYYYFEQFGLKAKTGIDLPGEAGTIMHKKENMGLVEPVSYTHLNGNPHNFRTSRRRFTQFLRQSYSEERGIVYS